MKISILSLILLLNADLISSQPHDAVECRYSGDMLYNDCSNGYVGAELDNVGNLPDSCCLVYIFERDCDGTYGCSSDSDRYCLPMWKKYAEDYLDYILEGTSLYPDLIEITCDGEKVYEWKPTYSSSLYIRSITLFLLVLLLLI